MKRRIYNNPPIDEALCHIVFAPSSGWNATTAGHLHIALRDTYSGKPQQGETFEAVLNIGPGSPPQVNAQQRITGTLVRVPTGDGTGLLTIAENSIAVHSLRPYCGREEFLSRIARAIKAVKDNTDADAILRVGIRYINRIQFKSSQVDLAEYVTTTPRLPDVVDRNVRNFLVKAHSVYPDSSTHLVFTFANAAATAPYQSAALLDIDVFRQWDSVDPLPVDEDAVMQVVGDLRDREYEAFESAITDKARDLFDGD